MPASIGFTCAAAVLAFYRWFDPTEDVARGLAYLLLVAFVCGGAWSIKEFYWPTLRRTPNWLINEMQGDEGLRAAIYGRRDLP
ncbi:hypothetical protein [Nocardioides sp. NPDC127503]|uniref:hypothetical protein n=1 Tax=Nocardioides sp. NPDC127503 TaxID=3154516 RepID=UPI0033291F01